MALEFIQPPPPGQWEGTSVALGEGRVGGTMIIPIQFLDYYIEQAKKAQVSPRDLSARQMEKGRKEFEANMDRAAASETLRALNADVATFGVKRVFSSSDDPHAERTM